MIIQNKVKENYIIMANYEDDRFPKASDGYILSKWYMENKYQVIEILEDTLSPEEVIA